MKTILLARHGQASFGEDNYDKLSELGVQQASILGQYFADQQRQVDNIFTGTMIRQQDTAKHFCRPFLLDSGRSIPARTLAEFNEFDHEEVLLKYCDCSSMRDFRAKYADANLSTQQLVELFQQSMIRWHLGKHDSDYHESWIQFAQRASYGLQQVANNTEEGQTSLVFTSGGVIASIVSYLLAHPHIEQAEQSSEQMQYSYSMNAFVINNQLVNTGVTTILLREQSQNSDDHEPKSHRRLLTLNDCQHLLAVGREYVTLF